MTMSQKEEEIIYSSKSDDIQAICLGSGRFLRSVLVPFLSSELPTAIFQTRGRSFVDSFLVGDNGGGDDDDDDDASELRYPVDTIEFDGSVSTRKVSIHAVGTLGSLANLDSCSKSQFWNEFASRSVTSLRVIGVGVTEAGLSSPSNATMIDLTHLLHVMFTRMTSKAGGVNGTNGANGRICILNTDNVPNNGDVIRAHILHNARQYYPHDDSNDNSSDHISASFIQFLEDRVSFLNSMVDRITSARKNSGGLIPSCEPTPNKALVICDPKHDLPDWMRTKKAKDQFGVVIRHEQSQLESDIALKLRVANATHTAVAHVMALSSLVNTGALYSEDTTQDANDTMESLKTDITPPPSNRILMKYLDTLYQTQILPASTLDDISPDETQATWDDWRKRLQHKYFGLSTFFITQNGAAKGGIRFGPSVKRLVIDWNSSDGENNHPLNASMAYAMAAILRFLTPVYSKSKQIKSAKSKGVYVGWLDNAPSTTSSAPPSLDVVAKCYSIDESSETVSYADGLRYNLSQGWYEFRCVCPVVTNVLGTERTSNLPEALSKLGKRQPIAYEDVVRSYLLHPQGGDLSSLFNDDDDDVEKNYKALDTFVSSICTLYARMVHGDNMIELLWEMIDKQHVYHEEGLASPCSVLVDAIPPSKRSASHPLPYRTPAIPSSSHLMKSSIGGEKGLDELSSILFSEVSSTQVIDLHTHLLPPSHGALCLWGIDELLTYHYLVAEYFMTAPAAINPEEFYSMNKMRQADLIWDALFLQRSPISEATRGVITTLLALGLHSHVKSRDLSAIRKFYDEFRKDGLNGAERFCDLTYKLSGVRFAIMTNIPFDSTESQHWRPKKKEYPNTFKSALRVDPLLAGDKSTVESALKASGYDTTLADARKYLHDWCDTIQPEYMMASTPHDFYLPSEEGTLSGIKKTGVNEGALKAPFAFTDLSGQDCIDTSCEVTDNLPTIIDENSDFLNEVLMPVCQDRDLPLALKIGAHRKVNPALLTAGDGMVAFADAASLARLCSKFPKVRFLATFLSRANQHEACVLASKFRNLHIYGCWWYCNNPSIIREISTMRVEMLGTAFTSQHSDARVIDQLIYKWSHSRAVIADVLENEYRKMVVSLNGDDEGWKVTREEIRRDVWRLFGGSYEDFMKKSLK